MLGHQLLVKGKIGHTAVSSVNEGSASSTKRHSALTARSSSGGDLGVEQGAGSDDDAIALARETAHVEPVQVVEEATPRGASAALVLAIE